MKTYPDFINKLPDELIYEILQDLAQLKCNYTYFDSGNGIPRYERTILPTLYAVSLTSRRFYSINQQILYHTIRVFDYAKRRKFFRTIVEEPNLAKYVKNVFFDTGISYESDDEPPPEDLRSFFVTLKRLAPFSRDIAWRWYRKIQTGDAALELICLLLRLENIRRFQLVSTDEVFKEKFLFLIDILHSSTSPGPGPGCYFFAELEEMCIDLQDTALSTAAQACLPLPNLRMLFLSTPSKCRLVQPCYPLNYPLSDIRDLRFLASDIPLDSLKHLFQCIRALEILHYDFSARMDGGDFIGFISAVETQKDTLKVLRITAQFDLWKEVVPSLHNKQLWGFCDYPLLASLEFPDVALIGSEENSSYPKVSSILPPLLETLSLTASLYKERVFLFLGDLAQVLESFPRLKRVVLRGENYVNPDIVKLLSDLQRTFASGSVIFTHERIHNHYDKYRNCPVCKY